MLRELRIQNLAVVEDVTLEFAPGLNVLTGSTGAGKSLILSAVNLLLGERGSVGVIRAGEERAVVEGTFILPEPIDDHLLSAADDSQMLVLRREIHNTGRSHAFISGRPATLKQMQELSNRLIEPHGQNEQLQLKHARNHVVYVDRFARNSALHSKYATRLAGFKEKETAMREFDRRIAVLKEKQELLEHRVDEIERAALQPDEKANLEQEISLLDNAQEVFDRLGAAMTTLDETEPSALEMVSHERANIVKIAALNDRFQRIAEQLESAEIFIKEAVSDIRSYLDAFEFDPGKLAEMQDRLAFLIAIERRYGKPLVEIMTDQQQWKQELESVVFEDEERRKLLTEVETAATDLRETALELRASRSKAATRLDALMTGDLGQLMMKGAAFRTHIGLAVETGSRLVVDGQPVQAGDDGIDDVRFHVRTNPGEAEGAVADVASSGELSRIALALKSHTSIGSAGGVLIFDELDAGVGADLGDMIADKLDTLARNHQTICITHMPQIAARGARHLVVRKETVRGRTFTSVGEVNGPPRVNEIARMLGGDDSAHTVALASELLENQARRASRLPQ